jgi:nucleotide-binding universal stress UspA family protein
MYAKILVPFDGSEASAAGLAEAIKIAKSQGSEIRLMYVVNDLLDYGYGGGVYPCYALRVLHEAGRSMLDEAEIIARREGIKTNSIMLESVGQRAADLILAEVKVWSPDLVVMGTHGRRGLPRLVMGSDAEGVVRVCPVPVLLVHGALKLGAMAPRVETSAA